MIKFKHLLALSMTAALAANASADATTNTTNIQFTGNVVAPTCKVILSDSVGTTVDLGTVTTTAFNPTTKVTEGKIFNLKVVEVGVEGQENNAEGFCPSISTKVVEGKNGETFPTITITAGKSAGKYLANTGSTDESVAIEILDPTDQPLDLTTSADVTLSDDKEKGVIAMKARFVALKDKVMPQTVNASMNLNVIYK